MLLAVLNKEGYRQCMDFLYLPIDFTRHSSLGYAFVNFTSPEIAKTAMAHLEGFKSWPTCSPKVCTVAWGEPLQGIHQHVERYRNSPVMHDLVPDVYKPIVLKNGVRQRFPAPSKRIRPPRLANKDA